MQEWRERNREESNAKMRANYQKNKEERLRYAKEYRETHKEKRASYQKKWMVQNQERRREAARNWDANNRDKRHLSAQTISSRYSNLKGQARRRRRQINLSRDEYELLIISNVCHYCGGVLPVFGSGLDRKDNLSDYSFDNCVPCCERCNKVFGGWFNYDEKMILAQTIKEVDSGRVMS